MEWGFTPGGIAAIDDSGNGVGHFFLGDGFGLGQCLGRRGNAGDGGKDLLEGSMVTSENGFVHGAVKKICSIDSSHWGLEKTHRGLIFLRNFTHLLLDISRCRKFSQGVLALFLFEDAFISSSVQL